MPGFRWVTVLGAIWTIVALLLGGSVLAQSPTPTTAQLEDFHLAKRDWQGNYAATDRFNFYKNLDATARPLGGGVHPPLEYDIMTATPHLTAPAVVYKRGSTLTCVVTLWNDRATSSEGSFQALGARLTCPGVSPTGPAEVISMSATGGGTFTIGPYGTKTFTVTITGAPDYVAVGDLGIKFSLPVRPIPEEGVETWRDNGTGSGYQTWTRLCLVDAQPLGWQAVPWTDLLEFSCRWAFGATTADLAEKMTLGMHDGIRSKDRRLRYLYTNSRFLIQSGTWKDSCIVKLTEFLDTIWINSLTSMYCDSFAVFIKLSLEGQGASSDATRLDALSQQGGAAGFITNELCPASENRFVYAGLGSSADDYQTFDFAYHVVCSIAGMRYDSSSAYVYDPFGSTWLKPAYGWTPDNHWQGSSASYSTGLVHHAYTSTTTIAYPSRVEHTFTITEIR